MAKKETKAKSKRPTALKRDLQNAKRRLINKSFKSQIRTSIRDFETALKSQDREESQKILSTFYSMMDKGVKRGIFKSNKANRMKAKATAKVAALSS